MLTIDCKPANYVSRLNIGVKTPTLKERLEELMQAMEWDYPDLLRESGESHSVVSQWLGRGSKTIHSIGKTQAAERLEAASGYAALWLAKGIGPKYAAAGSKRDRVIADMVRHSSTLREVARMQVRARDDLTPEQQEELLAAIESFEREANRPGGLPQ